MAEYVKLRLAAAKVGVTVALLGVIAGISERARAVAATKLPTAGAKLPASLTGGVVAKGVETALLKLEKTVSTFEHKLQTYDSAHKLNQTFLKIDSANSTFLKIDSANSTFLKIDDASATFLKIDDAASEFLKIDAAANEFLKISDATATFEPITSLNATFLKIDDATNEFLKLGGTAANSAELGGLKPSQFVQGSGNVLAGDAENVGATPQNLVGDATIAAQVSSSEAGVPLVTLINHGSAALTWTSTPGNGSGVVAPGGSSPVEMVGQQADIQVFDANDPTQVWTLTISRASSSNQGETFVGQMVVGQL